MEEMVICKTGWGDGISDEGWLERSAQIDSLLAKMEFQTGYGEG